MVSFLILVRLLLASEGKTREERKLALVSTKFLPSLTKLAPATQDIYCAPESIASREERVIPMHRVFECHTLKCFTRPPVSKKESCSLHVWAQNARQTGLETRPNSLTKRLSELFFDCYYVGSQVHLLFIVYSCKIIQKVERLVSYLTTNNKRSRRATELDFHFENHLKCSS